MKNDKISFALKITNWCNMRCAHCSECSGPHIAPDLMPLASVEKYMGEFNAMPMDKWEYMVFTGGEAMAPYYQRETEYIPKCLDFAGQLKMAPFIKTNGAWGAYDRMRTQILRDCAGAAYRNDILSSLDISVDEFHNNIPAVTQIINDVVRSDYLCPAVRISVVGLNTKNSHIRFAELIERLRTTGLTMEPQQYGIMSVGCGPYTAQVYYDLYTNISGVGRAANNGLGKYKPNGQPDFQTGHCFQIDNNDIATLNYYHRTPVNNRPVFDVVKELVAKTR